MIGGVLHTWEFEDVEPHHRSWPYPPTRLELQAKEAGVDDETIRAWLYAEIGPAR
jgi:hypothetical protein